MWVLLARELQLEDHGSHLSRQPDTQRAPRSKRCFKYYLKRPQPDQPQRHQSDGTLHSHWVGQGGPQRQKPGQVGGSSDLKQVEPSHRQEG